MQKAETDRQAADRRRIVGAAVLEAVKAVRAVWLGLKIPHHCLCGLTAVRLRQTTNFIAVQLQLVHSLRRQARPISSWLEIELETRRQAYLVDTKPLIIVSVPRMN